MPSGVEGRDDGRENVLCLNFSCFAIKYVFHRTFSKPLGHAKPCPRVVGFQSLGRNFLSSQEGEAGKVAGTQEEKYVCFFIFKPVSVWLTAVTLKLSKPRLGQQHHIHNLYCPQGRVSSPVSLNGPLHRAFFSLTPYCLESIHSVFMTSRKFCTFHLCLPISASHSSSPPLCLGNTEE